MEIKSLEQLTSAIVDCPHSTPIYQKVTTEFSCIRTSELKDGYIDWTSMKYVDKETFVLRTKRLTPREGDVIYGREGSFGEAVRVPKNAQICLGQRVLLLRPESSLCTSAFLWALLRSKLVYNQALNNTKGSTVGHIDVKAIKKFKVFCPPLVLQQNFSSIMEKIEILRKHSSQSGKHINDFGNLMKQEMFWS